MEVFRWSQSFRQTSHFRFGKSSIVPTSSHHEVISVVPLNPLSLFDSVHETQDDKIRMLSYLTVRCERQTPLQDYVHVRKFN